MIETAGRKLSVHSFIFARGGSKGVPNKNIRLLAGKPLIDYSIEAAFESKYIDKVIVSTDDAQIANVARSSGAEIPFIRPAALASDESSEWLAWQHALINVKEKPDIFISVPTTSPLRHSSDLDECIEKLVYGTADLIVTGTEASRNPCFNMVKSVGEGVELAITESPPISRRQDSPEFFDLATVAYVTRPEYILNNRGIFNGKVEILLVSPDRAIDIDTLLDFKIADFLMREKINKMSKMNAPA